MSKRTEQRYSMRLLKLWIRMPRELRYLAIIGSMVFLYWFFKWLNG